MSVQVRKYSAGYHGVFCMRSVSILIMYYVLLFHVSNSRVFFI
jgi:hypothetical protein